MDTKVHIEPVTVEICCEMLSSVSIVIAATSTGPAGGKTTLPLGIGQQDSSFKDISVAGVWNVTFFLCEFHSLGRVSVKPFTLISEARNPDRVCGERNEGV